MSMCCEPFSVESASVAILDSVAANYPTKGGFFGYYNTHANIV
jgi:hypothetical protein